MCNTWRFHIFKSNFHEACESKSWNNNIICERNPSPFEIIFCFLVHSDYQERSKRALILKEPQLPDAEELLNTTMSWGLSSLKGSSEGWAVQISQTPFYAIKWSKMWLFPWRLDQAKPIQNKQTTKKSIFFWPVTRMKIINYSFISCFAMCLQIFELEWAPIRVLQSSTLTDLSMKYPRMGFPPSTAGCFQETMT